MAKTYDFMKDLTFEKIYELGNYCFNIERFYFSNVTF